jgi:4-amino-4-deoxy-L-arabinose transferase-like glycosyltransferase
MPEADSAATSTLPEWLTSGGFPWFIILLLALAPGMLLRQQRQPARLLLIPAAWFLLFLGSDDRELFFPFTLALTTTALLAPGQIRSAVVHSTIIIAVFLLLRLEQEATLRVLGIEGLSAAAILFAVRSTGPAPQLSAQLYRQLMASLLACCSLAI